MADGSIEMLKQWLDRLEGLVGDGSTPPSLENLVEIRRRVNEMLGFCGPLRSKAIPEALHAISKMADAVELSPVWLPNSFHHVLSTMKMMLDSRIDDGQMRVMLEYIWKLVDKYGALSKN
ncbi:hypothetical protein [Brevundimonas bacteroides]|uniref:hypothetical protein n=1 Tax=Brevundimonas bacteroides TaxID=74311 RepID=UPI0012ED9976|nr:hypothetical protein [Brevundimonas bacteroides]